MKTSQTMQVKNPKSVPGMLWQISDKALDAVITKALRVDMGKAVPPQHAWETLKTQINTGSS